MKNKPDKIIKLILLFLISVEVTIITSLYIKNVFTTQISLQKVQLSATNSLIFVVSILAYIVVFSLILIFLLKKRISKISMSVIDIVRLLLLILFINIFVGIIPSIIISGIILFIENKIKRWWYSDAINIITDVVIAVTFALYLGILGSLFLITALALYDYISVFISKHMISLAKAYKNNPEKGGLIIAMAKKKKGLFGDMLFLGNGDIAFPNILVSAQVLSGHLLSGILEGIAAIIGLLIILLFGERGKGYPALAFIVPIQLITQGLLNIL